MTHLLRKRLPFILCSLLMFGAVAGCKTTRATIAAPTATKTTIQVTLQNSKFGVSEPLGVLIKNTGATTLYAVDGKAACTILELQQYDSKKKVWVTVDQCRDNTPPSAIVIRPQMSEPFTLAPTSAADPNSWDSGQYRIAVSYSTNSNGTANVQVAYSEGFTIQGS